MEKKITDRIDLWSNPPYDEQTTQEVRTLLEASMFEELEDRFYRSLEFGTGGLRGKIGAGTNRMNIYTVGLATQALAAYLNERPPEGDGVVISYDSRHMSDDFSKECASILAANGIKVYLFEQLMPTPICSYAIRHLGACAGIMITASHNPPEYNGYKVFWNDGGQIVPPVDRELVARVSSLSDISLIKKTDYVSALSKGMIVLVGGEVISSYKHELSAARVYCSPAPSPLRIVYTPLHGTGITVIPDILRDAGYVNLLLVDEQSTPDGNFPTVKYPNPEEADALEMAVALAEKCDADILLATDPDADRVGVGVRHNGKYLLLNGNQAGTLLLYFVLSNLKEQKKLTPESTIIKTIVTTEMQRLIAQSFGCQTVDVLTGFKWIADKMLAFDSSGENKFVFGGEESYGYLPVNFVRDKDAVSASLFFCDMADQLKRSGRTMYDLLEELYVKYGKFTDFMHYVVLEGAAGMQKIELIMKRFRENPPQTIAARKVSSVKDFKLQVITAADGAKKFGGFPLSDVLQYTLENGTCFTIRPSGTEPKIKFYISAYTAPGTNDSANAQSGEREITSIKNDINRILKEITG